MHHAKRGFRRNSPEPAPDLVVSEKLPLRLGLPSPSISADPARPELRGAPAATQICNLLPEDFSFAKEPPLSFVQPRGFLEYNKMCSQPPKELYVLPGPISNQRMRTRAFSRR